MNRLATALIVEGLGPRYQDRARIFIRDVMAVGVVADGAGGTTGGAEAASLVVEEVRLAVESGTRTTGLRRRRTLQTGLRRELPDSTGAASPTSLRSSRSTGIFSQRGLGGFRSSRDPAPSFEVHAAQKVGPARVGAEAIVEWVVSQVLKVAVARGASFEKERESLVLVAERDLDYGQRRRGHVPVPGQLLDLVSRPERVLAPPLKGVDGARISHDAHARPRRGLRQLRARLGRPLLRHVTQHRRVRRRRGRAKAHARSCSGPRVHPAAQRSVKERRRRQNRRVVRRRADSTGNPAFAEGRGACAR